VARGLARERRDVEAAEDDEDTPGTVAIGDRVGTPGRRDVHLDPHEVGRTARVEVPDVLVLDADLVRGVEVAGERREAEGREERVLDGAEEGALRLGEGGQQELDLTAAFPMASDTSRSRGPSSSSRSTRCHRPSCRRPSATFRVSAVRRRRALA
jgi:hypothetical protein